jgi:hypothetical protein
VTNSVPTTSRARCSGRFATPGCGESGLLTRLRGLLVLHARVQLGRRVDALQASPHSGDHAHPSPTASKQTPF